MDSNFFKFAGNLEDNKKENNSLNQYFTVAGDLDVSDKK